jgi:hypothetical protein
VQVVTRGGFHVGNGINWKGQVFAKMRNHTSVNKMTVRVLAFIVDICLDICYCSLNFWVIEE